MDEHWYLELMLNSAAFLQIPGRKEVLQKIRDDWRTGNGDILEYDVPDEFLSGEANVRYMIPMQNIVGVKIFKLVLG